MIKRKQMKINRKPMQIKYVKNNNQAPQFRKIISPRQPISYTRREELFLYGFAHYPLLKQIRRPPVRGSPGCETDSVTGPPSLPSPQKTNFRPNPFVYVCFRSFSLVFVGFRWFSFVYSRIGSAATLEREANFASNRPPRSSERQISH